MSYVNLTVTNLVPPLKLVLVLLIRLGKRNANSLVTHCNH